VEPPTPPAGPRPSRPGPASVAVSDRSTRVIVQTVAQNAAAPKPDEIENGQLAEEFNRMATLHAADEELLRQADERLRWSRKFIRRKAYAPSSGR